MVLLVEKRFFTAQGEKDSKKQDWWRLREEIFEKNDVDILTKNLPLSRRFA